MFFSPIANFEHFRLVPRTLALFANQFHVREELHFDDDGSVSLPGFAAPAGNVERKMSCGKAALMRFRSARKQVANAIERLDVSHGVRSRRAPDGRLINQNNLVNELFTLDLSQKWETLPSVPSFGCAGAF